MARTTEQTRSDGPSAEPASLVPDGCRIGVVLRTAIAANVAGFAAAGCVAPDWSSWLRGFVEAAAVIEPALLITLLAWCGLRRVVKTSARWQRLLAMAVPVLAVLLVGALLGLASGALAPLPLAGAAVAALAFGAAMVHYLELHARAHSPVLAEARFQALQSRIRPHFIFNSLNAAMSMVRVDADKAERMLESLADLIRAVMGDVRKLVPFARELELCRRYVEIEQTRLGDRLQVDWQIGAVHPRVLVPQLLLQPLIENAVRYGAEKLEGVCRIVVRARQRGFKLEVFVSNPVARDPVQRESNQMGLSNIRGRLALIYDLEAQMATRIDVDRFEVILILPVENR